MIEPPLLEALRASQALGFLGPGEPTFHVEHAAAFSATLKPGIRVLDLGSGGGVPGLILGVQRPDLMLTLLDSNARRCAFLRETLEEIPGLRDRVAVVEGRAEVLGRDGHLRGSFDAVVSRSFGSPAVTAECGAPFLTVGGLLVVSEPPDTEESARRWPEAGVAVVGLRDVGRRDEVGFGVRVLELASPCPEPYPRRTGLPNKRPIF
jgi:16S rRNA (guanine527-N7)-methyltransferase